LPILVATESKSCNIEIKSFDDKVYCPILVNKTSLNKAIIPLCQHSCPLNKTGESYEIQQTHEGVGLKEGVAA